MEEVVLMRARIRPIAAAFCVMLLAAGCGGIRIPAMDLSSSGASTAGDGRYLAVIDDRGDRPGGQVHIVDTVEQQLAESLIRPAPDGVFLPDGETLLLGSALGLERLAVGSWKASQVIKTAPHGRSKLFPSVTRYALNPDGKRLHLVVYHPEMKEQGQGRLAVQTVDLSEGKALPDVIEVPPCAGRLLASGPDRLYHICLAGPMTELDLRSGEAVRTVSVGPISYQDGVAYGGGGGPYSGFAAEFLRGEGKSERVVIVTARGAVLEVAPGRESADAVADLAFPKGQVIPHRQAALSPDGKWLYVGIGPDDRCNPGCSGDLDTAFQAEEVRVYDTATWELARGFKVKAPFLGIAVSPDGEALITVSPAERTIDFMNPMTGEVTKTIRNVGKHPSLVIAGPPAKLQ